MPKNPHMSPLASQRMSLTTSQAAEELGVSLSTIRRWNNLGYLKSYRTPGGQRRFSREQLETFMASLEGGGYEGDTAGA